MEEVGVGVYGGCQPQYFDQILVIINLEKYSDDREDLRNTSNDR